MNTQAGPLEDLEAMLDRSLNLDATPPRWQSPYAAYSARVAPASPSSAQPPTPQRHPMRVPVPPPKVPVRNSGNGPQALYQPTNAETSAIPNATATRSTSAPRGLRLSPSQQSVAVQPDAWDQRRHEAAAEAQRLEQIRQHEAAEQERFEQQHREHLRRLNAEQQAQEQQLERLRQVEIERQRQQQQMQQQQLEQQQQLQQQHEQQQQQQQQQWQLQERNQEQPQPREEFHVTAANEHAQSALARQAAAAAEQEEAAAHAAAREEALTRAAAAEAAQQEADRRLRESQERQRQRDLELQRRVSVQRHREHEQINLAQNRVREQRLEREVENEDQDAQYRREGAATMVQRTQDNQGNVTTRVVKKGVEDFDFLSELGTGSYSTVFLGRDKQTLRKYAIKVLDKVHIIKEEKVKYVEIEKNTLNRMGDHPGIIHLYYTFQDRQSLYFVLDFAPNGELLHLIKRTGSLNEACAQYYAAQLLDAIEYMHDRGVVHRDMKPENILLDYKMRIKITDFGTAKLLNRDATTGEYPRDIRANSFVGTAEYVTPELLMDKAQGKSADIWAWGCVLYQMIAAAPPFQGNTQFLTFQKIAKLQYPVPPGFPFLVRDLLKHVLVKPSVRWTTAEIKKHEFFADQEWTRKALWSNGPPRLQPYRPSVNSMKPRATAGRAAEQQQRPRVTVPRPSQSTTFVPTAAGLQPVNPTTLYGMPVSQSATDVSQVPQQAGRAAGGAASTVGRPRPRASGRPVASSASAASSALYRTPQPQPTSSYQQRQNRINEITRRVQDRGRGESILPPSSSPSSSSPTLPGSPRSPSIRESLPQPPLTQLESQWSTVLISAQERILRLGSLNVFVSTHMPPQAAPADDEEEETNDSGVAYSYGDDTLISKIFSSKNKPRVVIITTAGRLLVIGDDRKVRFEVPLGVPQVQITIVPFKTSTGRSTGKLVVQTYNRVLTFDSPDGEVEPWMDTIELSRRYYAQLVADQERNSHNAAAAAAIAVSGLGRRR